MLWASKASPKEPRGCRSQGAVGPQPHDEVRELEPPSAAHLLGQARFIAHRVGASRCRNTSRYLGLNGHVGAQQRRAMRPMRRGRRATGALHRRSAARHRREPVPPRSTQECLAPRGPAFRQRILRSSPRANQSDCRRPDPARGRAHREGPGLLAQSLVDPHCRKPTRSPTPERPGTPRRCQCRSTPSPLCIRRHDRGAS